MVNFIAELSTLRRTKRPASLEFLGASSDDSKDITVQRASLATAVDDEPNKRYLTLLPSEQNPTDINGYQVPLSCGPPETRMVVARNLQRPKSVPSLDVLSTKNYHPIAQYQTPNSVHNHTYQKFRPPPHYAHPNVYIPTASWC
ncbi:uncharacterized protein LOC100898246 [Galendromus occidentalis]|uniref:Uncharacterized protein LOC100898246 n=1 Tax=Galendromus occidentalis TaxID=34638 RepID=A0AAJ6QNT0_9ACAR|nr:uncharacterized protein LOC100898246 [Galendromus occidentalis]